MNFVVIDVKKRARQKRGSESARGQPSKHPNPTRIDGRISNHHHNEQRVQSTASTDILQLHPLFKLLLEFTMGRGMGKRRGNNARRKGPNNGNGNGNGRRNNRHSNEAVQDTSTNKMQCHQTNTNGSRELAFITYSYPTILGPA